MLKVFLIFLCVVFVDNTLSNITVWQSNRQWESFNISDAANITIHNGPSTYYDGSFWFFKQQLVRELVLNTMTWFSHPSIPPSYLLVDSFARNGAILYMDNYATKNITSYNLETNAFTNYLAYIPGYTYPAKHFCLIYCKGQDILYINGGHYDNYPSNMNSLKSTKVLNLTSLIWFASTTIPDMNLIRSRHTCECINNVLYSIAGCTYETDVGNSIRSSIETINTTNIMLSLPAPNSWTIIGNLQARRFELRSTVILNRYIAVIGGLENPAGTKYISNKFDIIDTETNSITIGTNLLSPVVLASVLSYNDDLYVFGGKISLSPVIYASFYQKFYDPTTTKHPTFSPTNHPTANPTTELDVIEIHINLTISNEDITVLEVIETLNTTIIDFLDDINQITDYNVDLGYNEFYNSDNVVVNIILYGIATSIDLSILPNMTEKVLKDKYGSDVQIIYMIVIVSDSPKISSTESTESQNPDNDILNTIDLRAVYQWVFISILIFTLVLCITGYIHSKKCRINNYFRFTYLISAAFQSLDVFSDVCFALTVWRLYRMGNYSDYEYMAMLLASVVSIIVPILISMGQVFVYSKKYWMQNNSLSGWFIKYNKVLYIFSFITGSSFSALLLLNSHLYSLTVFSMGVNRRDLLKFTTKRIYSVIPMENLPQICIQVYFLYKVRDLDDNFIAVFSLIFSLLSVIISVISMVSERSIIHSQNCTQLSFDVLAVEFNGKKSRKKVEGLKIFLVNHVLLKFDKNLIEIPMPQKIPSGLSVTIHIYTNDQNDDETQFIEDVINKAVSNGTLTNFIKNYWNMNTPNIKNISTKTIQSKDLQQKLRNEIVTSETNATMSTDSTPEQL